MERVDHVIGGERVAPIGGEYLPTFDPVIAQPWAEIARGTVDDVDRAVSAASSASPGWRHTSPSERAELLWALGDLVADHVDELAFIESRDVGKVIREMRGQISGLRRWYHYYASLAHRLEGQAIPQDSSSIVNYTVREPFGVIGIIPAFNSPTLLTSWALGPALAAGNTVVIKAPEVAAVALVRFVELFAEAGFPPGVVNVVNGYGDEAGEALVRHPDVRKVFFTGGVETGRRVAAAAADTVKPVVLELGGKSANIVFDDAADLDAVASGVVAGIYAAAGQTCVAGSRLLAGSAVADELVERLSSRCARMRIGDPTDDRTEMGPIAQERILENAVRNIRTAIADGAMLAAGGRRREELGAGWFLEPTVVDHVDNAMDIAQNELFAPVLSVIRFDDDADAVRIANDSRYGLAAGLWTRDLSRAHSVAHELEAGTVWVNTYRSVSFRSPFGGWKNSGYGRENGLDGLNEMTQSKSVWIETNPESVVDPFALRS
jgi:(Z)-2-((N-methylformamido)methylene)-5-hydroxybutyrolactone dehydrogenase